MSNRENALPERLANDHAGDGAADLATDPEERGRVCLVAEEIKPRDILSLRLIANREDKTRLEPKMVIDHRTLDAGRDVVRLLHIRKKIGEDTVRTHNTLGMKDVPTIQGIEVVTASITNGCERDRRLPLLMMIIESPGSRVREGDAFDMGDARLPLRIPLRPDLEQLIGQRGTLGHHRDKPIPSKRNMRVVIKSPVHKR